MNLTMQEHVSLFERQSTTVLNLADEWRENASSVWDDESDDVPRDAVLHSTTHIFGGAFHVTAIAVYEDADGLQVAVDSCFEDDLRHAYAINGDGPFETVKIPGRDHDYVVVIYPFAL